MSKPQINTLAQMDAQIAENRRIGAVKRAEVSSRPGGLDSFRDRLIFEPVVSAEEQAVLRSHKEGGGIPVSEKLYQKTLRSIDKKVGEFYKPYEASFPIDEEREARGGVKAEAGEGFFGIVTERNFDPDLKKLHGEFREFMYVVRDPDTGKPIGGMNFIVYPAKDGEPLEGKYAATVHSTYVFFDPEHRNLGLARILMAKRDQICAEYIQQVVPEVAAKSQGFITLSEQNIPELMSPEAYMLDSAMAVPQEERLAKWYAMGYNRLNFSGLPYDGYVQPALEEGGEVCDVLSLNAYSVPVNFGPPAQTKPRNRVDSIEASTLRHHLHGFFGTSVVGSATAGDPNAPDHDPTMVEAMRRLDSMGKGAIPTVPHADALAALTVNQQNIRKFLSNATPSEIQSGMTIEQIMAARLGPQTGVHQQVRLEINGPG